MKKVILVDGNNLMFRSYYATLYSGSMMTNKEGFPTNALFGFVNMMNKIINEETPEYIMVAFDIGKTFRHEKYDYYKGKRDETPDDLKKQFPVAKKILNAMGIKYFEAGIPRCKIKLFLIIVIIRNMCLTIHAQQCAVRINAGNGII